MKTLIVLVICHVDSIASTYYAIKRNRMTARIGPPMTVKRMSHGRKTNAYVPANHVTNAASAIIAAVVSVTGILLETDKNASDATDARLATTVDATKASL